MAVFNLRLNEEGNLELSETEGTHLDGLISDEAVMDWLLKLESTTDDDEIDLVESEGESHPRHFS